MQLNVDQNHVWALTYDREDGAKDVVFHTFASRPSTADIIAATNAFSAKKGYRVNPGLTGPV